MTLTLGGLPSSTQRTFQSGERAQAPVTRRKRHEIEVREGFQRSGERPVGPSFSPGVRDDRAQVAPRAARHSSLLALGPRHGLGPRWGAIRVGYRQRPRGRTWPNHRRSAKAALGGSPCRASRRPPRRARDAARQWLIELPSPSDARRCSGCGQDGRQMVGTQWAVGQHRFEELSIDRPQLEAAPNPQPSIGPFGHVARADRAGGVVGHEEPADESSAARATADRFGTAPAPAKPADSHERTRTKPRPKGSFAQGLQPRFRATNCRGLTRGRTRPRSEAHERTPSRSLGTAGQGFPGSPRAKGTGSSRLLGK